MRARVLATTLFLIGGTALWAGPSIIFFQGDFEGTWQFSCGTRQYDGTESQGTDVIDNNTYVIDEVGIDVNGNVSARGQTTEDPAWYVTGGTVTLSDNSTGEFTATINLQDDEIGGSPVLTRTLTVAADEGFMDQGKTVLGGDWNASPAVVLGTLDDSRALADRFTATKVASKADGSGGGGSAGCFLSVLRR